MGRIKTKEIDQPTNLPPCDLLEKKEAASKPLSVTIKVNINRLFNCLNAKAYN